MMGLWLLVPEHLELGTYDLLCAWTGRRGQEIEPRLALQMIHEAALCQTGVRRSRSLAQKGFEAASGLPFVASDQEMHKLLGAHCVAQAQELQVQLGRIRRASGHFDQRRLALDPHNLVSYTKRQTQKRKTNAQGRPHKVIRAFFCLDMDTKQPVAFCLGSASTTAAQATPELLELARQILNPADGQCLVVADSEHFNAKIFEHVRDQTPFELLVRAPDQRAMQKQIQGLPPEAFRRQWAGYATVKTPYRFKRAAGPAFVRYIQRVGEAPDQTQFRAFVATADRDEIEILTRDYPDRWRIEEFFNANQKLGWQRAGTLNLNIRYGQMTMALCAQALVSQMRTRIDPILEKRNAESIADRFLRGLNGDLRVQGDTAIVTYYNAPRVDFLRQHYEGLPQKLASEGIDPRIPWLYGLKLDFRFR